MIETLKQLRIDSKLTAALVLPHLLKRNNKVTPREIDSAILLANHKRTVLLGSMFPAWLITLLTESLLNSKTLLYKQRRKKSV